MCPSTPVQRLHALTASKVDLAPLPASPPPPRPGPPRPRRHFTGRGAPGAAPSTALGPPARSRGGCQPLPTWLQGPNWGGRGGPWQPLSLPPRLRKSPVPPPRHEDPRGWAGVLAAPDWDPSGMLLQAPGGARPSAHLPYPLLPPPHPNMDLKPQAGVCPPDPCQVEGGCTGWEGGPPSWQGPELGWGPPHTLPGPPYVVGSQGGG